MPALLKPLSENWDIAFDVAGIAAQDDLFEDYLASVLRDFTYIEM